jgi:hypothetical protein
MKNFFRRLEKNRFMKGCLGRGLFARMLIFMYILVN